MSRKFIPESDQGFKDMAVTFAQGIAGNLSTYGFPLSVSELITSVVNEYVAALATANNPATRTPTAIAEKDACRVSAVQVVRLYANLIRPNAGISDASKIAIGIYPPSRKLSKRRCPATSPEVQLVAGTSGCHTLKYRDSVSPESKAKPFGARALQLFCKLSDYGAALIPDPSEAKYVGEYARSPFIVEHEFKDGGKTAVYFGRWVGARNEHGPWSLPLRVQVMFAGSPGSPVASTQPSQQTPKAENDDRELKLAA